MSAGILVVSENETDGRMLCEQLNAGGFRSECVTDIEDALSHLARRDLGLCLSLSQAGGVTFLPDLLFNRLVSLLDQ